MGSRKNRTSDEALVDLCVPSAKIGSDAATFPLSFVNQRRHVEPIRRWKGRNDVMALVAPRCVCEVTLVEHAHPVGQYGRRK